MQKELPQEYINKFEVSEKIGLIASVSPEGLPHITLISTLQANTPTEMIWGQFVEGLSKEYVKTNPKTGFLIMSLQKELWRGKALWTREMKEGPEYTMFNNKPLFRYNSYCGIHTVHFMDLIEISDRSQLDIKAVALGSILTKLSKRGLKSNVKARILKPWAEDLFNKMNTLKFLSYIGIDGFPVIIPVIQAQAEGSGRIIFSSNPHGQELASIPENAPVSIFGLSLTMENVLVQGAFSGFQRSKLIKTGVVDIQRVYNSMPPKHGYIYPVEKLEAVTDFC